MHKPSMHHPKALYPSVIKPLQTGVTDFFWDNYFRWSVGRHFQQPEYSWLTPEPPTDKAVLLLANHLSWWDGLLLYLLNNNLLKRRFHVMMLKEELQARPFLRTAGAFSIDRSKPRSMLETMAYTRELLARPENVVLIFPQGRIESAQVASPTFEMGIKKLIEQPGRPSFSISFCICFFDYLSRPKPTPYFYLSTQTEEISQAATVKQHFLAFYHACKAQHQQLWA